VEVASAGDDIELTARAVPTRLLVVLTTVGLVLGALGWGYTLASGPRDEFRADRRAAITRADDFAVAFITFDLAKKAEYQRRVKNLVTPRYYSRFVKTTDPLFTALRKSRVRMVSGNVNVLSAAVESIDQDSAVVLLAINSSVSVGQDKTPASRPVNGMVTLTKVKGEWLVTRFNTGPVTKATVGDGSDGNGAEQ
jgi:hypothetical protein